MAKDKEYEYKEIFLGEASESHEELNKLFTELEKDIKSKKIVDNIFRIVHTLKGNAMGLGFVNIAELSHVMEDIFSEVKNGKIELDREIFKSLYKACDILGEQINALTTDKKVAYKGTKTKLEVILRNARESADGDIQENIVQDIQDNPALGVLADESLSLYERIGGAEFISTAIERFYDKVAADGNLTPFFTNIDFRDQVEKQKKFLEIALGLSKVNSGNDLKEVHRGLVERGLTEEHFEIFLLHFAETLQEFKIENALTDQIVGELKKYQDYTLGRGPDPSQTESRNQNTDQVISDREETDEEATASEEDNEMQPKISFSEHIQIPVKKLDNLLNLVGELIIERDSLIAKNIESGRSGNYFARLQRITSDLQYGVMDVRLVQVGFLFNKFHRILRDAADIENKKVELVLEGTENEIDRNILKIMSDSLIHLIRNCVGHGIESPEERRRIGKPETGKILLRATNEKDTVNIEIIDDGRGIDVNQIRKKAIENGLVKEEAAHILSQDEIMSFIFVPGFSNADKVTEISGRGVGMDVVKRATESIGGRVSVETTLGKGTKFTLSLPSSMAVKGALLFELGGQEFAVPLSYTEAVISLRKSDIHKINNGLMSRYLDKTISLVFLKDVFSLGSLNEIYDTQILHTTFDQLSPDVKLDVLIVSYKDTYMGLVVDKLLQQKEIVEKTLPKPIDQIELVSGATILGNGNVCVVLDISSIISKIFKDKQIQKI